MRRSTWTGLLVGAVLLMAALAAADESLTARFEKAGRLYEAGQVELAAREYERILEAGLEDGRVHYNLGTAYARLGQWGRSVLHLERARALRPRDPEIRDNLEFVRSRLPDRVEEELPGLLTRLWRTAMGSLSRRESVLVALTLYWLAALLLALWLHLKHRRIGAALGWTVVVVSALLALSLVPLAARALADRHPRAVILADEVAARSGPGESNTAVFELHGGTTARILDRQDDWRRIQLSSGLIGWVPTESLERVRPEER